MTEICFTSEPVTPTPPDVTGGEVLTLTARGHAEGFPEACAGISAILYALAGWLENLCPSRGTVANEGRARRFTAPNVRGLYRLEPGDARIELSFTCPASRLHRLILAAWEMALIGLMQLEKRYPEALQVRRCEFNRATRMIP